jgi:hypothetical protein
MGLKSRDSQTPQGERFIVLGTWWELIPMWGRVIEIMIAVWLLLSPFIFFAQDRPEIVWGDALLALLIATLASLSYWQPTCHAHLGTLVIAGGMIAYGRFFDLPPALPANQNHIFVGFLLLMIAIIPNSASLPPHAWRE